jgi:F-type H+-transporting ATPase subunit b
VYLNATLLAQVTVFIVLALFTMKFVWPPIIKALDERATKIAEGLAAAERGRQSLDLAAKHSAETMREGKGKVAELIAQAEKRGQDIIEDAKAQARIEAEKVIIGAKAEIAQEAARAKELLRERVAELAVAGAEKILRHEIDASAHAVMLTSIKQEL